MINKKINIACWSVGRHAEKNMLPAISACNDVVLSGIYTRNLDVLRRQAVLYGCVTYLNENELLDDPSVDAVYLSSPTGVHAEQIRKCLNSGKSVLVEKTALPSLQQTKELVKEATERNLVLMEAFMYRFHAHFSELKRLVESKKYGDVIKLDCEFGFPHLNQEDIRYRKDLCGGATYDAGAYTLSSVRYLLGNEVNVVWSKTIKFDDFQVDTRGYATLSIDNIVANCAWVFGASYSNKIRVWCEKGHILCDRVYSKTADYESEIIVEHNGDVVERLILAPENHFINMLSYFSRVVGGGVSKQENEELIAQASLIEAILSPIKL
jgi:NDP-hexose-3-ketoreductase